MKTSRSLRFRLTVWYSALLFASAMFLAVLFWIGVRYAVVATADETLLLQRERLASFVNEEAIEFPGLVLSDASAHEQNAVVDYQRYLNDEGESRRQVIVEELSEYATATPAGELIQVRGGGVQVLPSEPDTSLPIPWIPASGGDRFSSTTVDGSSHRVLNGDVSLLGIDYRIQLTSSLQSLDVIRAHMLKSLLVATPVALALCWAAGIWVARESLRPVDEISEHAARVTVQSLSERIPIPATGDGLERLARSFNTMLERLEISVKRIEQFSADASHELRIPLSVIRTTAELALRHGRSNDEYTADLQDIHDEAERLTELVDVLLSLSRTGVHASVPMADVDLGAIANYVGTRFHKPAEDKGLELIVHTPDEPVLVHGNEAALRRLVMSLVENALEHTDRGRVAISAVRDPSLALVVEDTGKGIPHNALEKVFDRFYRVDRARGGAEKHFGLGLSIAKRIAALHDARLTVSSQLDEGSRFSVEFARA